MAQVRGADISVQDIDDPIVEAFNTISKHLTNGRIEKSGGWIEIISIDRATQAALPKAEEFSSCHCGDVDVLAYYQWVAELVDYLRSNDCVLIRIFFRNGVSG